MNIERTEEALATGADRIAVACPFCYVMMDDGVKEKGRDEEVKVQDIAELLYRGDRSRRARTRTAHGGVPTRRLAVAGAEVSRRHFLAKAGLAGSVAAAAQFGMLARAAPATAGGAISPPTPTVPPIAARRALKRLLAPLPPWIRTGPTNKPRVAITIDDMWGTFGADNANAAMDVAKAKGVKLSFFPTGGALEEHIRLGRQAVWQRAIAEGHDIGNHTYTHTNLTKLNDDQIRGEINHTKDLLAQCLGPVPYTMRLMRPPGGRRRVRERRRPADHERGHRPRLLDDDVDGRRQRREGQHRGRQQVAEQRVERDDRAHPLHRVHARWVADVDRPPAQRQEARTRPA